MKRTFKRTLAALIAATTMAVGIGSLSVSASDYDSYNYFAELGVRVWWSGNSEYISLNLGYANGSSANLCKYRVSVYPHANYPDQTQYQFTKITAACNFDRSDSSTPFSFTKTASGKTKLTAQTSGDIYGSYAETDGTHTVTLYRTGYSSANGTGSVTLISN